MGRQRTGRAVATLERGFTLVELLVVIVIVGLLAAIAVPVYLASTRDAQDSAAVSDVRNTHAAVIGFVAKHERLPTQAEFASVAVQSDGVLLSFSPGADQEFCVAAQSVSGRSFRVESDGELDADATCL